MKLSITFAFVALAVGLSALLPSSEAAACVPSANYLCDTNPTTGTILVSPKIYISYWAWPAGCSTSGCAKDTENMIPILEQNLRPTGWTNGTAFGMPRPTTMSIRRTGSKPLRTPFPARSRTSHRWVIRSTATL
jgi:hypothetical protein